MPFELPLTPEVLGKAVWAVLAGVIAAAGYVKRIADKQTRLQNEQKSQGEKLQKMDEALTEKSRTLEAIRDNQSVHTTRIAVMESAVEAIKDVAVTLPTMMARLDAVLESTNKRLEWVEQDRLKHRS